MWEMRRTHRTHRRNAGRARVLSVRVTRIGGYDAVVVRKDIRNIYLRVKGPDSRFDGPHLELSTPRTAGDDVLERFVAAHRAWIATTLARITAAGQDGRTQQEKWTPERRRAATAAMRERLAVLLPHWTEVVGRGPTRISLRVMKTRWGSCTPATGRIRLNLELADMPDRLLEYVLVHELTHLRASGHGPAFQRYMDVYLPDWRSRRREINTYYLV